MSAWDNPRTVVRPPRLYVGALIFGVALEFFYPLGLRSRFSETILLLSGIALIVIGGVCALTAIRQLSNAGTNVPTYLPAKLLVTRGIYALSRNPIYLGMTLLYSGLALISGSAWCLIFLIPVLLVMEFGVIRREEKYLQRKFTTAYADYKTRVRRWL